MNYPTLKHTHCQAASSKRTIQSLSKSALCQKEKEIIKNAPRSTKKEKENRKNEKHKPLTKYKKHRADKGFIEFSALNKLHARLTEKYSESPTIFYTEPLRIETSILV